MPKIAAKWNKNNIRAMLETSDKAVCRGVMAIFNNQTPEEQVGGVTVEDNGIGFNGVDADWMSQMAVNIKHYGKLTPAQMNITRPKILKYARQISEIANRNEKTP